MILRLLARRRTGRRTAIPARTVETPRRSSVNLFKGHTTRSCRSRRRWWGCGSPLRPGPPASRRGVTAHSGLVDRAASRCSMSSILQARQRGRRGRRRGSASKTPAVRTPRCPAERRRRRCPRQLVASAAGRRRPLARRERARAGAARRRSRGQERFRSSDLLQGDQCAGHWSVPRTAAL